MNPYINSAQQTQDVSGLNSIYQNASAQQQYQNQAAMQGQQLAQQAGQTAQGGMNPMAMAAALRKGDPKNPDAPNMLQNAQAYMNSKFGRDPLSPDSPETAATAQQYYGNTYNPDAGWSS